MTNPSEQSERVKRLVMRLTESGKIMNWLSGAFCVLGLGFIWIDNMPAAVMALGSAVGWFGWYAEICSTCDLFKPREED